MLLRLEDQLIIHCARTRVEPARAEAVKTLLTQELDWNYIISVVGRNRIEPLFFHALSSITTANIPITTLETLRKNYQQNIKINLLLKSELLKILESFEHNAIYALPLKGVVLAEMAYGTIALRDFGDLDILVTEADYQTAEQHLFVMGFVSDTRKNIKAAYHQGYVNSRNRVSVELHRELFERYRGIISIKDVPDDVMTTINISGMPVNAFKLEFLLLYLCVHGYKHHWERLSWVCDVAELIRTNPDLEWNTVLQYAEKFNLRKVVTMGLFLAASILECDLPEMIREEVFKDKIIEDFAVQIKRQIFSTISPMGSVRQLTDSYVEFNFGLLTDPIQRVRYLYYIATRRIHLGPNQRDKDWVRLPEALAIGYFFVRPVRLIYQYGWAYLKTIYHVLRN